MTEEQIAKSIWLNRAFHKDKKVKALKSLTESDKIRAEGISKDNEGNVMRVNLKREKTALTKLI